MKTIKLLERNICVSLCELGLGFGKLIKAKCTKEKKFIKIFKKCFKDDIKEIKKPQTGRNILFSDNVANILNTFDNIADNRLIFEIYTELYNSIKKFKKLIKRDKRFE